jgi:diacylglycerol kinase family enzyme
MAVSRSTIPPPSTPPGAGTVPPPSQRVAVVVNGNAKNVTDEVISTLDQILMGGDLFVSHRLRDCREIARTLVDRGYGTVLTGGGDGTFMVMVTEVVHEARRENKPLPRMGLLRLGTGNALAWVAGASSAKGRGLAADIQRLHKDAGSRPLRLIEVEGVIAPFCGLGADAVILADYQALKRAAQGTPFRWALSGRLGYVTAAAVKSVPNYMLHPFVHCRVVNDGAEAYRLGRKGSILGSPIPRGEVIYEGPARLAAMSTIPYYGFGFRLFPYAEERLDRMHLRISNIGVMPFVKNARAIWKGEFDDPSVMFDYLVEAVSIDVDPPTAFQIGGDEHGQRDRIQASLSRETIRLVDFYAPPSAQ